MFQYNWFIATFPLLTILYGILILLTGFFKVQWAMDMIRMKQGKSGKRFWNKEILPCKDMGEFQNK